jgi:hypothetical protein
MAKLIFLASTSVSTNTNYFKNLEMSEYTQLNGTDYKLAEFDLLSPK